MGLALCSLSFAQSVNAVSVGPMRPLPAKRGETVVVKLPLAIKPGFHINSNAPNDPYLIPLRITWTAGEFEVARPNYPKPSEETYPFSAKPLSVFSGDIEVETSLKIPAAAAKGSTPIAGKLRYQACNDKMCLPPKTVDVQATIVVQ